MGDNKRYYWIKLKTDFFNQQTIDFLLSQKNGCEYIVLYQMLCLNTANNNGEMCSKIGEMIVPYDVEKIVRDTKYFDFDTVTIALELFKKLGLIYEENDKILKITNFNEMVGSEAGNPNAQRQKRFRERQKQLKLSVINSNANSNAKNNEEIEIDIRDRDKSINKDINNINNTNINNKKERKKETNYDKIINSMVENEEIKNSIYEFIKMRKLIKKPMTDRALTMLINKLEKLSSDKDIQIKILEKSILKNWTDIYELKGDKNDGYIRECSNDDGSEYAEFV